MIKIEHLVKSYGANTAVDDISFEVARGEIVGLLGPNGAGKSTTMNILAGYLSSSAGRVTVDGLNVLDEPLEVKRRIGYLPEQPPLYLDMTVEEYLIFVYNLKGCTLNRTKHLAEICEVVKLTDVYHRLIKNLSKGFRQRVGIAQALIGNPPVIIFDEPTVGLDPKQIIEVRNLIRTLGRDHTVILSTHILQEVQAVCDRIIIINKGKIVADELTENINRVAANTCRYQLKICGPQREVLAMLRDRADVAYAEVLAARDGDAYVYHVESQRGVDIRKSLFFAFSAKGWPIVGMETLGLNLEDIFISVVDRTNAEDGTKKAAKGRRQRTGTPEKDIAQSILDATAAKQEQIAPMEGDE
ncbi:MAG: ATP-binding cassette domain-containing protein [Ruminococcaceae bacterium]|nr:ATP-binding cassette domain-containing protein [Oscillospiraceae bacterium]MBQ2757204.1 ATP-binding cassette domain-containing protein [Clostridia bacterium]